MAKNYVQDGEFLDLTAPSGGVVSGRGVKIGHIFGIAEITAAAGDTFTVALEGVFDIAKTASDTFSVGDIVYWDDSAKTVTSTSSANTAIGRAVAAAGGSDATARVLLNETSTP